MTHQCSKMLVVLTSVFSTTSSVFLSKSSGESMLNASPALRDDVVNLLLHTQAEGTGVDDNFMHGCLSITRALVADSDGSKRRVASHLYLICSGLQLPLDVEICERYRSTLLEHLFKEAAYNLMGMDYPCFCTGMDKVVAEHKSEIRQMAISPVYNRNACFKLNASYGYKTDGGCDDATIVKMLGPAAAVDVARNEYHLSEAVTNPVASAMECQTHCSLHKDCKFFNYLTENVPAPLRPYGKSCWLLRPVSCTSAIGTEPGATGTITGPRECPPWEGIRQAPDSHIFSSVPAPAAPAPAAAPGPAGQPAGVAR
jgi:hypothetical protein